MYRPDSGQDWSSFAQDNMQNYITEEELDELYDLVLRGYSTPRSISPVSTMYTPDQPTPRPPAPISVDTANTTVHRSDSLSPTALSQPGTAPSPAARRGRPLPVPPGSISATPSTSSSVHTAVAPEPSFHATSAPQASSSAGPGSYISESAQLARRNSRRKSRSIFNNAPVVFAPEIPDQGGLPVTVIPEEGGPTSPTTEFPDHYDAFLPSYYRSPEEDPLAERSLGYGDLGDPEPADPPPIVSEQIQASPPAGLYRPLDAAPSHINDYGPVDTHLSANEYSMLRPPSAASSFDAVGRYMNQEESRSMHRDSGDWRSAYEQPAPYTPTRQQTDDSYGEDWAGPSTHHRRNTEIIYEIRDFSPGGQLGLVGEDIDDFDYDDPTRFINPCLLSNLAVQLRDKVPRGTHVKGSIPYPRAFTGKDIVSTLHSIIKPELERQLGAAHNDRRAALLVARSLQTMLFFYEVEWGARPLTDGVEDVYMFMDDQEGGGGEVERAELPTGIVTMLTECYSALCDGPGPCYSYACPRRGLQQLPDKIEIAPTVASREDWHNTVPPHILSSLSHHEIARQTIIHRLVEREEQYIQDLRIVETVFIRGLRTSNPPVMTPLILEDFIQEVFGNILELLDCNRRLLEVMNVRQREQYPVIQSIGDIFLDAATEFRMVYPEYVGRHPLAEKRLKEETDSNPDLRLFLEKCSRQIAGQVGDGPRLDFNLKHFLNRPAEHLQKYPVLLDAAYRETEESNPDGDYISASIAAIQDLQSVAQLRTFQSAMGKGSTGKWEWHDLVSPETLMVLSPEEKKRQSVIFELIKGEMAYVRDLENIETIYVRPLRNAEPPIISPERLDQFLSDVFHNFKDLHAHHRRLVNKLHEIQRDEHPRIKSITAPVFDAALNFREAYMEYIPNYPIAAYRIDDEMAKNPEFKNFVTHTTRHPDAHRLDMKSFINRPIPRLLRYELLLREILGETPAYHEDRSAIPQVIDVIKALGRETEPGVTSAKLKVELWKYNSNLVFKEGEYVDMDLLGDQRSLLHTGKLLRQPDNTLEWNGWTELFVLLFDNYLVMTKPRETKDGVTKYQIYKRPIPLDLISIVNFSDQAIQRSTSILRNLRNERDQARPAPAAIEDARSVFPCTIHHNGRLGGPYILYAETAAVRAEWKMKLEEAVGLRTVVQEANKVFEMESLSVDTFIVPSIHTGPGSPVWHDGTVLTGKVTCSVPFNTSDGRGLVAIGCAEGIWIGYRHDSRSLRRVLHLKMVTQCAMLEEFGLFLVLADKVLFAYHIEALVPTTPGSVHASQAPQRINGKDVQFFSVGVLQGRTLVIYMKRKNSSECVLHAVEPVTDKIQERPRAPNSILSSLKRKTEWFRTYKEFILPDAYDLIFLKARVAILCSKGFVIMDLTDFKSVIIPQKEDPRFPYLTRRCDSARPLGMFRSSDDEFLLCYDEFGLFVDKHGNPSRPTGIIEWEGKADRVAMHAPYIMLFDTRFIEVRHVETGRLCQIMPGNDVRCIWDGRYLDGGAAVVPADPNEENMIQEPRVHAVMNVTDMTPQPGRPPRGIIQHVFELYPTVPLYLPGSLASPINAPYFPVSYSPPRSPPLRAQHI